MAMTRGLYLQVGALVTLGVPPTDGVTGAGVMPRGTLYLSIDSNLYMNRGTKAHPHWVVCGQVTIEPWAGIADAADSHARPGGVSPRRRPRQTGRHPRGGADRRPPRCTTRARSTSPPRPSRPSRSASGARTSAAICRRNPNGHSLLRPDDHPHEGRGAAVVGREPRRLVADPPRELRRRLGVERRGPARGRAHLQHGVCLRLAHQLGHREDGPAADGAAARTASGSEADATRPSRPSCASRTTTRRGSSSSSSGSSRKLVHGNTYALKQRDGRGVVTALYLLDPDARAPARGARRVGLLRAQARRPVASAAGAARRARARDHPRRRRGALPSARRPLADLCLGPGGDAGPEDPGRLDSLFANGSNPGGVLTAPGAISDATAARLKAYWDTNYTRRERWARWRSSVTG